jgi:hypothetical protein
MSYFECVNDKNLNVDTDVFVERITWKAFHVLMLINCLGTDDQ